MEYFCSVALARVLLSFTTTQFTSVKMVSSQRFPAGFDMNEKVKPFQHGWGHKWILVFGLT